MESLNDDEHMLILVHFHRFILGNKNLNARAHDINLCCCFVNDSECEGRDTNSNEWLKLLMWSNLIRLNVLKPLESRFNGYCVWKMMQQKEDR